MGRWVRDEAVTERTEAFLLHDKLRRIYSQIQSRLPQSGTCSVHPHYTLSSFIDSLNPNEPLVLKLFEFLVRVCTSD